MNSSNLDYIHGNSNWFSDTEKQENLKLPVGTRIALGTSNIGKAELYYVSDGTTAEKDRYLPDNLCLNFGFNGNETKDISNSNPPVKFVCKSDDYGNVPAKLTCQDAQGNPTNCCGEGDTEDFYGIIHKTDGTYICTTKQNLKNEKYKCNDNLQKVTCNPDDEKEGICLPGIVDINNKSQSCAPCNSYINTCKNGGKCNSLGKCDCLEGYYGPYCDKFNIYQVDPGHCNPSATGQCNTFRHPITGQTVIFKDGPTTGISPYQTCECEIPDIELTKGKWAKTSSPSVACPGFLKDTDSPYKDNGNQYWVDLAADAPFSWGGNPWDVDVYCKKNFGPRSTHNYDPWHGYNCNNHSGYHNTWTTRSCSNVTAEQANKNTPYYWLMDK